MAATAVSMQDGGLAACTAGAAESAAIGLRPFIVGYIWIDMSRVAQFPGYQTRD